MPDTSKIPYAYRRLGMGIERTPFQEDVASVADKAAEALAVTGAAGVDLASRAGRYFLGTPKTELYKGLRIPSPQPSPGGVQPLPAAAVVPGTVPIGPTRPETATPAAAKLHPAAGTKDLWDYASKLSPERLKAFVDKNQRAEGFEGIGYVETKDPTTGKMRIEPMISRPAPPPGLTAKQLTAVGHYQQGLGAREQAAVTAEYTRELKKEATEIRRTEGENSLIRTFGAYETLTGEKGVNPAVAMFKLIDSGYDIGTLSKQWQATANQVKSNFKAFVQAQRETGSKATPEELKNMFYIQLTGGVKVKK